MDKKPVFCINDGVVYESCSAAAAACGLPVSYVSKQLNGKIKKTANFVFVAVRGDETLEELARLQREYLDKFLNISLIF